MAGTYYITTAIDYVNGRPHLGHAYEKVLTDVLARYHRRMGEDVFFLTGVDEHGQKVQQSAEREGLTPQKLADKLSKAFRDLYDKLYIEYDDFVRTTEPRHKDVVRLILQKLYDEGEIYESEYEGYYSTRQEQFLTDKEMVYGEWPEQWGEVVKLKEKNYFFKLSKHQNWLVQYLKDNPDAVFPSFRVNELLGALDKPIPDLCISRPKERLEWGIPLPFDESQVTYVWFDALINYISIIGYDGEKIDERWPAVHVIGKDILIPAHGVYWMIMLHALGVEPPKQLLVHGFWTAKGMKMSKSTGNVIDPLSLIDVYGVDAFRYFVMREMSLGQDADFSLEQFHVRYDSELLKTLGNLVNRVVNMIGRYRKKVVPALNPGAREAVDDDLEEKVLQAIRDYRSKMEAQQIHLALVDLWRGIARANAYVDETAPFSLAKDETKAERLDTVLYQLAASLKLIIAEVSPFLPETVAKASKQMGLEPPLPGDGAKELTWPEDVAGLELTKPKPLYKQVLTPGREEPEE